MKTGALDKYVDRLVRNKKSALCLEAIESSRIMKLPYKQMNQIAIDSLYTEDGIILKNNVTYRGSPYFDIGGTTGYFVTRGFSAERIPKKIAVVLKLDSNDSTITAQVARDINNSNGNGNFVSAPLTQIGSTGYYRSDLIDVSSQPVGQSVGVKIIFSNSTAKVQGIGIYYR